MLSRKVLVVEDNTQDFFALKEQLHILGYLDEEIVHCNKLSCLSGNELSCFSPTIIFTNLNLSGSSAGDSFSALFKMFPLVPIIVLTGPVNEQIALECIKAGAGDYLVKGQVSSQRLNKCISFAIERNQLRLQKARLKEDYERLFEQNPVASFIVEKTSSRFLNVNTAAIRKYGYSKNEFLQLGPDDLLNGSLGTLQPCEDIEEDVVLHYTKGGVVMYVSLTTTETEYDGRPSLLVTVDDMTERVLARRKEQKLKASEEHLKQLSGRLEKIMDYSMDMICTVDEEGRYVQVSAACNEIFGYSPQELSGKHYYGFVCEQDLDRTREIGEQIMSGTQITNFENRIMHKKGYPVPVIWSARWDEDEKIMFAVARNATALKEVERAKAETEQRFTSLVQSSADVITIIDDKFNYIYQSPSVKGVLGYDPKEFSGKSALSYIHPDDIKDVASILATVAKDGEVRSANLRFRHANGDWRWIEATGIKQVGNPAIKGIVVNSRDITRRKLAEQLIEEQNAQLVASQQHLKRLTKKLEKVMNSSLDVICTFNKDGIFIQASAACKDVWGYTAEELVGTKSIDYVLDEYKELTIKTGQKIRSGTDVTNFENWYRHKDGHPVPLLWSARWDHEEEIMFCVARNAAAIKEAERVKAETEQRFTSLVQNGVDLIGIIGEDAKYIYTSPSVKKILGYEPDSFIGKDPFGFIHPEDRERVQQEFSRIWCEEKVQIGSFRFKHSDGSWRWIETLATNMVNDTVIKGIVTNSRDITDRKEKEAERELIIKELTKSNNDLKQFSFITSHNLRAPLSNILGLLNIIDYESAGTENIEMLQMINQSARQLKQTIDDLSRILIVKNNVGIDIAEIPVKEVLDEVGKTFINSINDIAAEISVDLEVENIRFNRTYLESIFINLISNAIKYRVRTRKLNINISTIKNENNEPVLLFSDNGIGINMERYKDRLCGLYQRFHDNIEGQGIGLFIIKSQITALGGRIDIKSEVGKGTTFIITFKNEDKSFG